MREKIPALLGLTLLPLGAATELKAQPQEEPINILWLFGEDISPWMPAYGDNTVETPNIDFLAENGVLFTNCYATCSVSSPSRSAIITGAMQTTIGMHNHRTGRTEELIYSLPEGVEVLPQIFRESGFYTFNAGKDDFNWHYEWSDYWGGEQLPVKRFFGKEGVGTWRDRAEGQPFFGVMELYGGKNHSKVEDPVDPSTIVVPPYYPNVRMMQEQLAVHYNQIKLTDNEIAEVIEQMKRDGIYENTIIIFMSDNGYQTLRDKQFLYDGGIHMPFIVAAPGNHALLERLGVEAGEVRDDMISLLDVTATSLAMADIEIPDYMESLDIFDKDFHRDYIVAARDRCDFTIDRIRAIRTKEFKYIRNFMTDRPLMQAQYRDVTKPYQDFMEVWRSGEVTFADEWLSEERPAEELYDIVNDPHEIHNLASDPTYSKELRKMRRTLDKWIKQTGDKGDTPEPIEELQILYERWGDRCVNWEYDVVKTKK
ncbi:MAG: sulfatase [Rikenellaceae bacterium]